MAKPKAQKLPPRVASGGTADKVKRSLARMSKPMQKAVKKMLV